nr:hypothetical protein [Gordonia insulae]
MRAATLDAWRASPTRFAEDSAAEHDLVTVGYRDRLFTELAANAADAATAAGTTGRLAIWVDGSALHVANTGAPLTIRGVRSLLALRVSAKPDEPGPSGVGRFGVGFTATAAVADRVEVRSTTGSLIFDRASTSQAVGASAPEARDAGGSRRAPTTGPAPLLRLAWPDETPPAAGFDTEIILYLRDATAADSLVATASAQATDLLLELDALAEIVVAETVTTIRRDGAEPDTRAVRVAVSATAPDGHRERTWIESSHAGTRWLVEIEGAGPVIAERDVLRAPTPTDIELSLPARCITDLALTPDRRNLHPDADISTAATGYSDLVGALARQWRPLLIPDTTRVRNRDDATLIEAVLDELRESVWLPAADDGDLVPSRAVVLADLTDELAGVLAPIMGDLAHPDVSERRHLTALRSVGVTEMGLADLAERLIGTEHDPAWWRDLYAALAPLVTTSIDAEELGTLPIPRSDGRMNIGARGLFVTGAIDTAVRWIPTVASAAYHPLVERLGAQSISVTDALADPALAHLTEHADDDELAPIAHEVFALLAADTAAAVPEWLSALPIPDQDGELRPADELLLPDSPLGAVLIDDAPFGVVDADLVAQVGSDALRRIGVGWGFLTVIDDLPVAADHDLPDEDEWWNLHEQPPETLAAVRDLDLVDERRWSEALTLLAADDTIAPLLADRSGYTAWWLRHHAVVDGHPLGWYRAPSDASVEGVRDVLDHPHADALRAALGGLDVESARDADTLLDHLADPARRIAPGVAADVHAAIVSAARRGTYDPADLNVPQGVRVATGSVVERAVVLDSPWLIQALDPDQLVLIGGHPDDEATEILAEILDIATAGEELRAVVRDEGAAAASTSTEAVLFSALWGRDVGHGEVRLHAELWVRLRRNGADHDVRVPWWVDQRGVTHLERRTVG